MNKTGFVIVTEGDGLDNSRIENSTTYLSQKKAVQLRTAAIREAYDENYAQLLVDGTHRVEIHTPEEAFDTAYISVDGHWVMTMAIEAIHIDDEEDATT